MAEQPNHNPDTEQHTFSMGEEFARVDDDGRAKPEIIGQQALAIDPELIDYAQVDPADHARQLYWSAEDVARRHEAEKEASSGEQERLAEEARMDELSGLLNRRGFKEKLSEMVAHQKEIEGSKREAEKSLQGMGVLLIDLDGFKPVNDTLGHKAGDAVIQMVARRLEAEVRDDDVVGRWGGDEFVVALNSGIDMEGMRNLTTRIIKSLNSIREVDGNPVSIGASIGGVEYMPWMDEDWLVKRADELMYDAKQGGKNRAEFSDGSAAGIL